MNMLANRALSAGETTSTSTTNNNDSQATTTTTNSNEYHLHEALSLLPQLQHGMDVNPKFTAGPTGVEYTNNLAAFDLLGVELVHGWLLDPQDFETMSVVQSKTYNELIETVINGCEAREELQKLEKKLRDLEMRFERRNCIGAGDTINYTTDGDCQHVVIGEKDESGDINANHSAADSSNTNMNNANHMMNVKPSVTISQPLETSDEASIASQLNEIEDIKDKLSELSFQITQSEVANAFLTFSGHQLTYYGLEQLHTHVGEDDLCVFFRNNHFATLTKHNGVLYLLVTDLGYANTPEIVWEKLDNIDGDTEYCNEFFEKPAPRAELKPGPGPTIAPELLLAQRSQAESDYQLALAMSKGDGITVPQQVSDVDPQRMDDEECKLIEAAKELSLKTYQQESSESAEFTSHGTSANTSDSSSEPIDLDREVAMSYYQQRATQQEQADHESEQLARQLQELEYARQRSAATNPGRQAAGATSTAAAGPPASKRNGAASSNCSIS